MAAVNASECNVSCCVQLLSDAILKLVGRSTVTLRKQPKIGYVSPRTEKGDVDVERRAGSSGSRIIRLSNDYNVVKAHVLVLPVFNFMQRYSHV